MSVPLPQIDHIAINVLYQMDRAEAAFRDLGFQLTERGYHTLGSINHLMMFDRDYLELIGLPEKLSPGQPGRPEIADAGPGINGLVLKTSDVDETYIHLQELGIAGNPPISFSRPVKLAARTVDACFRTVQIRSDVFSGGRVYFCEHRTPELVWRPEWENHKNGALGIHEIIIVAESHRRSADDFAAMLRSNTVGSGDCVGVRLDGAQITFLSPDAYQERYGSLASAMLARPAIFGALVIYTANLSTIRDIARKSGLPISDNAASLVIREPSFNTVIEFVAQPGTAVRPDLQRRTGAVS